MRIRYVLALCLLLAPVALAGDVTLQTFDRLEDGIKFASDIHVPDPFGVLGPGTRCATVETGNPTGPRAPEDLHAWAAEHGVLAKDDEPWVTIPVFFHVLWYVHPAGATIGKVEESMLIGQVDVLNAAYAGSGVQFTFAGSDDTENREWARMLPGSRAEQEAKQALAVDPAHTLNIYTAEPKRRLLGWSYFPWSYDEDHYIHGSVIHYGSLPGGYMSTYNEGDTATHEIGHYLGLLHTFQDGCIEPNDHCDDTPQEASPDYYCVEGRDTCPEDFGLDPIHNYMDYTPDYCMYEFTDDQGLRMRWAVTEYRPSLLAVEKAREVSGSSVRITDIAPNPFNPRTEISFSLKEPAQVNLSAYDLGGRKVRQLLDRRMSAGEHLVEFDGRGLSSGVYFLVLDAGDSRSARRLVLMK